MKLAGPYLLALLSVLALVAVAVAACESESGGPSDDTPMATTTTIFNSPRSTCVVEVEGATPVCVTVDEQGKTCAATPDHISFYEDLVLPTDLPAGMNLAEACLTAPFPGISSQDIAELIYKTADSTKNIHVSTAKIVPIQPQGRPTIQLGERTAYVRDSAISDTAALYSVEFEIGGRAYTVIAILGPENAATREEINAVALSMATAGS